MEFVNIASGFLCLLLLFASFYCIYYSASSRLSSLQVSLKCQKGSGLDELSNYDQCKKCEIGKHGPIYGDENKSNKESTGYCNPCPAGKYGLAEGSFSCVDCPPGKYSTASGSKWLESCKSCPLGSYQSIAGATHCVLCDINTYTNHAGMVACSKCGDMFTTSSITPSGRGASQCTEIENPRECKYDFSDPGRKLDSILCLEKGLYADKGLWRCSNCSSSDVTKLNWVWQVACPQCSLKYMSRRTMCYIMKKINKQRILIAGDRREVGDGVLSQADRQRQEGG